MSGARFERVGDDARIVGLGELLRPRPAVPAPQAAPPAPDPRQLLEAERKRVLDAAREEGLAAGLREAEARIETRARAAEAAARDAHRRETERLAGAAQRLEALVAALPGEIAALDRRNEPLVVEAVFAATVRLVGEVACDGARVVDACLAALAAHQTRPAVLRVRPDALTAVRDALPEVSADALRIEGDARLGPLHCRIESASGVYESALEQRLDALKQALLDALVPPDGTEHT